MPGAAGGPPAAQRPLARAGSLALAALAVLPLLIGAANDVQEIDPAQYAEITRRVVETGDWVRLRDNSGLFLNKPPLAFWLMGGSFRLLGETSLAVRLPSLLLALVALLATARIGALLWGPQAGVRAGALLAASVAFQLMVFDPKVDMIVTGFMALAVMLVLEARRRGAAMWLSWASAALGILTKGPIGLVIPALAVLPEALRRPLDAPDQRSSSLWRRLRPLRPGGALLLLALIVPWYWALSRDFGSYGPRFLLWDQSFGRLFAERRSHDAGPFFFLHTALWAFLPSVPFLVGELALRFLSWRRARFVLPPDMGRVPLWWLLLPFLGISLSTYKLPQYVFWLTPPAALLAAHFLVRPGIAARTWRALAAVELLLGALVVGVVVLVLRACFPASLTLTLLWLGLTVGLVAGGWLVAGRLTPDSRLLTISVVTLTAFNLFHAGYFQPEVLRFQPARRIGETVRAVDPTGKELLFVGLRATSAAAFYARRSAVQVSAHEAAARVRLGQARVAVVGPDVAPALREEGLDVHELARLPAFHTSKPTLRFLRARSRPEVLDTWILVALEPRS
ncbi:MAG TPA: glycosyltransferase family 39 protein [Myxococcaceae bacterium]|nr:glycosyltransferase family 39 protein [Myxococcaceae bacterium]